MQPFRALVNNQQYTAVYAAMRSTRKDGATMIYIVEKHLPTVPAGQMSFLSDEDLSAAKDLAHNMTTVRNSDIIGAYKLTKFDSKPITYTIHRWDVNSRAKYKPTDVLEKTQQDCLRCALYDFCEHNGYELITVL